MSTQQAHAYGPIPVWTFADKIRKARTTASMDQRTFATRLDITASSLAHYETGRSTPRFRDAQNIAKKIQMLTGIPHEWFLVDDDPNEPQTPNPRPLDYKAEHSAAILRFPGPRSAARLPRTVVRLVEPDPVTTSDIQRLLESGIYRHTRTKVILYSYQGMRASEIAAVHGRNVDLDRGMIYMLDAKGGREVWRPLHPLVLALAADYPTDSWWFPSPDHDGHVSGRTVSRVISSAMRRAGIPHRPHHMRAWFATEMLRAGVDAATVQFSMRHASAQTLRRYAIPSQDMAREGMSVLPVVQLPTRSGRKRAA